MKILIVRVSSLGDVVHNLPMVSDLHRHFPEARIDWLVEEAYAGLVALHPAVRRVIPVALRRWRKSLFSAATRAEMRQFRATLQAEQYDLIFDTQGLFKTAALMRLARLAPDGQRIGLANATEGSGYEPISRIFHSRSIAVDVRTHAVQRARLVAARTLGYAADAAPDFGMRLPAPASAPPWLPAASYAVFFHGTAGLQKRWAVAHWQDIALRLAGYGMPVLLPWGSDAERETAQRIAQGCPAAQVLPRLPLMDALLLAQNAALVVGVDSGLTHIAAALARPTVEIYCASPRWKTEGNWSPCIANVGDDGRPPTVDEVWEAIGQVCRMPIAPANAGITATSGTPGTDPQ